MLFRSTALWGGGFACLIDKRRNPVSVVYAALRHPE